MLVTGGSSGIGQAIAVRFAEYGANVAINYLRQPDEAADTEEQVHACVGEGAAGWASATCSSAPTSRTRTRSCAWSARRSRTSAASTCSSTTPASRSRARRDELSSADFDKVLAVNLRGSFLCAREAIRHFLAEEKPGSIVNVSSVHQLIPKPGYLGYSACKGGMQNLTRTLALEYAARGIRVNGVGPGATVTPINRAWIDDPVKRAQVEEHIPMRRAGDADEMAGVTCFLASDDGRLHHRPDDLRRRRPDAVPDFRDAVVVGVTRRRQPTAPLVAVAVRRGRPARHAQPRRRGASASRRSRSSARGGSTTSATCSTRQSPVFPGRYFRQTLVTTAHHANRDGGVGENDVNWITEQVTGTTQLGTHLDALSHLQIGDRGYNGWTRRRARRHVRA